MKDKKVKLTFIIIATLLLLGIVGFTMAFFNTNSTFNNLFNTAIYQTTASETFTSPDNWLPGDTTPKEVIVTNTGNIPVKVRVSYSELWLSDNGDILPNTQNGERVSIINLDNEDEWTKIGNYYYYNDTLDTNQTTSSFIESVTFNPNALSDVTCTTNGNTKTCSSSGDGYDNATYTLTIHIETVEADQVDNVWDMDEGTLYGIIKNEYKSNSGYAGLYTGEHKDSFTRTATKNIYYFTTPTTDDVTEGNNLLDKMNVLFGGYCWQMLRTTDTGGVKMIYNGVSVDGKCTGIDNSPYIRQSGLSKVDLTGIYAYGSNFTFDTETRKFKISGTIKEDINYVSDKSVIGYYTCKNSDKDAICQILYYVYKESDTNSSPYVHSLYVNRTLLGYGGSIIFMGISPFNSEYESIAHVGYMYNKVYDYNSEYVSKTNYYPSTTNTLVASKSLSTTYWYADDIDLGNTNMNNYTLINPYQVSSESDYSNLVGKYTFCNTSNIYNNTSVYYIVAVSNTTMYYKQLSSANISTSYYYGESYDYGETTSGRYTIADKIIWSNGIDVTGKYVTNGVNATAINYIIGMKGNRIFYEQLTGGNKLKYNESILLGDSISNTYSLNNPVSVTYQDWITNYSNYNNKYTCGTSSSVCSSPRYLINTGNNNYKYLNAIDKLLISKSRNGLNLTDTLLVQLDDLSKNGENYSDYKYTCNSTSSMCTEDNLRMIINYNGTYYSYFPNRYFGKTVTWNGTSYTLNNVVGVESIRNSNDLSTHHYTCINPRGTQCESVGYITHMDNVNSADKLYYIILDDGVESINDVLTEMLYANNVNTKDSAIKRLIEEWYYNELLKYDNYLEETIYCNNRSISNLGGWKEDGGMVSEDLLFKENFNTTSLSCEHSTDQFSIANDKARLKYKIGLATGPEMNLINNKHAREKALDYHLISPYESERNYSSLLGISLDGRIKTTPIRDNETMIHPVISLKPYTIVSGGTGTLADPYIIDTD